MVEPRRHKTPEERRVIIATLQGVLEAQPDVRFAYLYGSFLEDLPFHDVDVAVYLEDGVDFTDRALELAEVAERALREAGHPLPVDVRVLNPAPLGFRYHVFRGQLLLSREEDLRVREVVQTLTRYLDVKPLIRAALREAMTSWA
ncbi:MAG: nucleotidyltransferase domain-containing protein [Thermoflexales bacterium]|nr:nucleotidyltransferase domain-containing protein [Thermoflexales bacterium]